VVVEKDRDPRHTTPTNSARPNGAAQIVFSVEETAATLEVAMWRTRTEDVNVAVAVAVVVASQTLLQLTMRQTIRYVQSP
jgi:hypothetical protein